MTALPATNLMDRIGNTVMTGLLLAALPLAFFTVVAQAL